MTLLASKKLPSDFVAPDFSLKGIDGETYSWASFGDKKVVIIFMCVHCPYVQAIEDQIIQVQSDFPDAVVVGINPNDAEMYPEDSFENMGKRAEEMGYNFLYLRDETQEIARAYEAVCTPDIYVFNAGRSLLYHGRIEEVPLALLGDFDGEPIPSQGCSIKWS